MLRPSALLTLVAASLLGAPAAFAQSAAKPEAPRPYVVKFRDALPSARPDLTDPRVLRSAHFGYLRPEVMGHIQALETAHGFRATHGYSAAVRGFSAELTTRQLEQLRRNPLVEAVEPDVPVRAVAQTVPYGIGTTGAKAAPAALAGDGLSNQTSALANVRAVVIDTGVAPHPDLSIAEYQNFVGDGINGDCHGHGTHVAGTIGARDDSNYVVGMAPGVGITALKVLGCTGSGSLSGLVKAFDYSANLAAGNPGLRYVANASVGFPTGTVSSTLDTALRNASSAGVFIAVAAGNSADNTCGTTMVNLSSASLGTGVVAVGAVDSAYREASFSSYGACLGIWAPGVSVLSTSSTGSTATMSGTSMATPHVTGAAALVRATQPELTAAQVDLRLKQMAVLPGTLSKDGRAISHLDVRNVGASSTSSKAVASTSLVDFGKVKLRSTVSRTVSFTNTGTAPMTLTGLAGLPAPVVLSANGCTNVQPASKCSMTLTVTGTSTGSFKAATSTVGATTNATFTVQGSVVR